MPRGEDQLSWVAIQHGADADHGSLNLLGADGVNRSYPLPGRPGFAFPQPDGSFLVGLERRVQRAQLGDDGRVELSAVSDEVDSQIEGTIINDGLPVPGGIVFGCKDLKFQDKKAGLYLWRTGGELIQLRNDQICSNGKDLRQVDGQWRLIDTDSPTKQIVEYPLDLERGELGEPQVVVDLTDGDVFPDGLILTPDGESLIVALYNPEDAEAGEARQYSLDGVLQFTWRTPDAPQVTCPQLINWEGRRQLVLTTAVEEMPAERLQRRTNSGCLFIAPLP